MPCPLAPSVVNFGGSNTSAKRSRSARQCATSFPTSLASLSHDSTSLTVVFLSVRRCFFHLPHSLGLATDARSANVDCLAHFDILEIYPFPLNSFHAVKHGLAACVPVLIHKRWPPSSVTHIRGIDVKCAAHPVRLFEASTLLPFEGLARLWIAPTSALPSRRLSPPPGCPPSSIIFYLLLSWRPPTTTCTRLSTPSCCFAKSLECVHEILSHTLRRSVGQKHLRLAAVRSGSTSRTGHRMPRTTNCTDSSRVVETHQTLSSSGYR